MTKIERIIALIDINDEYDGVCEKASSLAQASGATLELLCIDYSSYMEDGQYFDPIQAAELRLGLLAEHRAELEKIAEPIRGAGVNVEALAVWGHPSYKMLNERIHDAETTLVIKSTTHHNKIARLFLANEDWDLIRYCPAAVMLVKGRPWSQEPVFLAAVDPDHVNDKPASLDMKLVSYSEKLAEMFDGSVHLFHSDAVPPLMGVYSLILSEEDRTARLAEFGKEVGIKKDNCHWTDTPIESSMGKVLEKLNASVVVMGAISRSGLDRVLIGSTAERLLDLIERDVLIVKPD